MPFNVNDLLIKPVYDVAFYGEDKIIPITDSLAAQSLTWSGLEELLVATPVNADTHLEDTPRLGNDVDTLQILNEGDGVRFDRTYEWLSDMSAWVYKFSLEFCVALAVTAFTSGNHNLDSIRVIITERDAAGNLVNEIGDLIQSTGLTILTAAEEQAFVAHFESNKPFKVKQGNTVRIRIIINATDTLVATSFEGIVPNYYMQQGSGFKTMRESALILHCHPALDHAVIALRDQSIQEGLDYSGVSIDGFVRGTVI